MSLETISAFADAERHDVSLREYYAGIALASLASSMGGSDPARAKTNIWKPEHIADKAVQLADAMIQRLARS